MLIFREGTVILSTKFFPLKKKKTTFQVSRIHIGCQTMDADADATAGVAVWSSAFGGKAGQVHHLEITLWKTVDGSDVPFHKEMLGWNILVCRGVYNQIVMYTKKTFICDCVAGRGGRSKALVF